MYKLIISLIFVIPIGSLYYRYNFFIKKDRGIYISLFLSLLIIFLDVLGIFSLNDFNQYKRLSIAIYELSIGYIAGFFVYFLTVLRREHGLRCAFHYKYINFLNSFLSPIVTIYYKNKFKEYKNNPGYGNCFFFIVPDKNVENILNFDLNKIRINNDIREERKEELILKIKEIRQELDKNDNLFKVEDILKMKVTISNLEIFFKRNNFDETYYSFIEELMNKGKEILEAKEESIQYLKKSNCHIPDVKCELTLFDIRKNISNEMKKEILRINNINYKEIIMEKMNSRKQIKLIRFIDDKDNEYFTDKNNCKYLLKDLIQILNCPKGYLFIFEK